MQILNKMKGIIFNIIFNKPLYNTYERFKGKDLTYYYLEKSKKEFENIKNKVQ